MEPSRRISAVVEEQRWGRMGIGDSELLDHTGKELAVAAGSAGEALVRIHRRPGVASASTEEPVGKLAVAGA